MGTYTLGEGAVKKKKFLHAWKPPHCRAGEELWNLRGECSNVLRRQTDRNHHVIVADQHLPAKMLFALPAAARMGWMLRALGVGPQGEDWG